MKQKVDRTKLRIKLSPQQNFEPGAIFQYSGSIERLKGFVLVHEVNPRFDTLSDRDKKEILATDHVVAEVLLPDLGYSDYCLFWIEKQYLRVPSPEAFNQIVKRIKVKAPTTEATAKG